MPAKAKYKERLFSTKNVLLYLLVGGTVYFLTYFLLQGKAAKDNIFYSPAPKSPVQMVVLLKGENNSKESGSALLTEMNGKTKVEVNLTGFPKGVNQPAHIHIGSCPGVGSVKYSLTNVVNGKSETLLDVSIDQLKSGLPLALNIHKSTLMVKTNVTCGDIK